MTKKKKFETLSWYAAPKPCIFLTFAFNQFYHTFDLEEEEEEKEECSTDEDNVSSIMTYLNHSFAGLMCSIRSRKGGGVAFRWQEFKGRCSKRGGSALPRERGGY